MTERELISLKNRYDIVGNDPALGRALEIAIAVAPTDLSVLVCGESGVGKEIIPKIIHQNSLRKGGKYFAVNCGAIPEGTVDSELFGHEKGAFTGAVEMRKGYFEEADGGTLFLDEIAELPLASQARLLRVLQSGEFIRVGSSKILKTNVRVIAATNVNLVHAVSTGKFREDLYYRLNTVPILMPALRERREDIHLLFRKFAADFSDKYSMSNIRLTEDAIVMLKNYRWPGNIRQLKSVAESVSVLESVKMTPGTERVVIDSAILAKHLPKDDPNLLPVPAAPEGQPMNADEREMIIRTLFQLKQDVEQLKQAVYDRASEPAPQKSIPQWHEAPQDPDEQNWDESPEEQPQSAAPDIQRSIQEVSDEMIRKAIEKCGSRKAAAKVLGISERTLYRRLNALEAKK